eukprot:c8417_g2_i1 orf=108-680(+)
MMGFVDTHPKPEIEAAEPSNPGPRISTSSFSSSNQTHVTQISNTEDRFQEEPTLYKRVIYIPSTAARLELQKSDKRNEASEHNRRHPPLASLDCCARHYAKTAACNEAQKTETEENTLANEWRSNTSAGPHLAVKTESFGEVGGHLRINGDAITSEYGESATHHEDLKGNLILKRLRLCMDHWTGTTVHN